MRTSGLFSKKFLVGNVFKTKSFGSERMPITCKRKATLVHKKPYSSPLNRTPSFLMSNERTMVTRNLVDTRKTKMDGYTLGAI